MGIYLVYFRHYGMPCFVSRELGVLKPIFFSQRNKLLANCGCFQTLLLQPVVFIGYYFYFLMPLAETVITSDDATIAVPAGIVLVTVGEETVKVVVK